MIAVLKNVCVLVVACVVFLSIPAWIAIDAYQQGRVNSDKEVVAQIWLPKNAEVHLTSENFDVATWIDNNGCDRTIVSSAIAFYQYQEDFAEENDNHLVLVSSGSLGSVAYRTVRDKRLYIAETNIEGTPTFVKIEKAEYFSEGAIKYTTGGISYFTIICATIIGGLIADVFIACILFMVWIVIMAIRDKMRYVMEP